MIIRKTKLTILLFIVFSLVIISANRINTYAEQPDKLEILLFSGAIQLHPPIEISDVQFYRDGGTTGVALKDKVGKEFQFCLDGRMQNIPFEEEAKPYQIYVGATHPDASGAEGIPIGGIEEKSLLRILQACIEQLSSAERDRIKNSASLEELSKKEADAARVCEIIETLQNRN